MYLLMLLATYMSAIYGYNLSIRPDYDRDVAHKKAAAVVYKFIYQHNAAKKIVLAVQREEYTATIPWVQPDDLVYAKDSNEANEKNLVLSYKQADDIRDFPLRKKGRLGEDITDGRNVLDPGRLLYEKDMMVSKVLCPDTEIDEDTVQPVCTSPTTPEGNVTGTCCGAGGAAYVVSYRKLDARWLNRLTNAVSSDFMWIFATQDYRNNVGVITWSEKSKAWEFVGKINLVAVYRKDREKFLQENQGALDIMYPWTQMNRTLWTMPNKVFKKDFFTNAAGTDKDFCKHGCVLKIDTI